MSAINLFTSECQLVPKQVQGKVSMSVMNECEWVCLLECEDLGYIGVNKKQQVKLRCLKQMEKSPRFC